MASELTNKLVSSKSEHYGTPAPYAELARYVLGRIACDPASDAYWNYHVIKAGTFYDERIDGLKARWFETVLLNAPGNAEKNMYIRPWWERLIDFYIRGEVDSAIWMGFQLGPLQTLQSAPMHPLQFVTMFPANRIDFLVRMPNNAPPEPCGAPMHANYVTLLPTRRSPDAARAMLSRFVECSKDLQVGGGLVRPL